MHSEVFLGLYCELLSKQGRARRAKALLDDGAFTFAKSHLFDVIELSVAIRLREHLTPEKIQRWINLESHLPRDRPLESYGRAQKPYLQFFSHQILADLAVAAGQALAGPMPNVFKDAYLDDLVAPSFDLAAAKALVDASKYGGGAAIPVANHVRGGPDVRRGNRPVDEVEPGSDRF